MSRTIPSGAKRSRLTVSGLKRALHRSMLDYRDLAAAIAVKWTALQPYLPPGIAPDSPKPLNPVREVEVMTEAVLRTLKAHQRARIVCELKLKKYRATIARLCRPARGDPPAVAARR